MSCHEMPAALYEPVGRIFSSQGQLAAPITFVEPEPKSCYKITQFVSVPDLVAS